MENTTTPPTNDHSCSNREENRRKLMLEHNYTTEDPQLNPTFVSKKNNLENICPKEAKTWHDHYQKPYRTIEIYWKPQSQYKVSAKIYYLNSKLKVLHLQPLNKHCSYRKYKEMNPRFRCNRPSDEVICRLYITKFLSNNHLFVNYVMFKCFSMTQSAWSS
ncbi:hypothetical protein CR513_38931, partial [Mucuna pruriens]